MGILSCNSGVYCNLHVWMAIVDMDILELSRFPWPGVAICCTSVGLGRRMVKEFDLKLILGMAER